MRDPVRLIDSAEDDEVRHLLEGARAGAPAGAKQRVFAVAAGVLAAPAIAGGAMALTAPVKGASLIALKWAAVSLVVVGVAVPIAWVRGGGGRPAEVPVLAPVSKPAAPPPPTPPGAAAEGTTALESRGHPTAMPPVAVARTPSARHAPSFPAELAALDEARAAIAAGATRQALSMLDTFAARFPRGTLAPEATVLRIEALRKAGDRPAAQRAADAFLQANPASPYAMRIHSLLGSNP